MTFRSISHVIFDMDGLILDTESIYFKAYEKVLKEINSQINYTHEIHSKILGLPDEPGARILLDEYDITTVTIPEFSRRVNQISDEFLGSVNLLPGILELIHHLYKNNIPLAIATSSLDHEYKIKIAKYGMIEKMMSHVVTGNQVQKGKPAPDIFIKAFNLFTESEKIHRKSALVLEDSPNGIKGAKAAGMTSLMIPHPECPSSSSADYVVKSAKEINLELFGLPSFNYNPITHVIFDMDDLIFNSNKIYGQTTIKVLKEYGKEISFDFQMSIIGMRMQEALPKAIQFYGLPLSFEGIGG